MDNLTFLLDHTRNPRNFGVPNDFDVREDIKNALCGDELTLYVSVSDDVVTEVAFTGAGCAVCLASMSRLTQEVRGRKLAEIAQWGLAEVERWIRTPVSPMRVKCALLGLNGLQNICLK